MRPLRRSLLLIFLFLGLSNTQSQAQSFSNLVVFGDSLSDMGNLLISLGDDYFGARITNGPVAVEVLADLLELPIGRSQHVIGLPRAGNNYSVASARVTTATALDFEPQLDEFLSRFPFGLDDDTLYVILIGANDLRDARDLSMESDRNQVVDETLAGISDAVNQLLNVGAKNFLMINLPDLAILPETKALAVSDPPVTARASEVSQRFNQGLFQIRTAAASQSGVTVYFYNLFNAVNAIVNSPEDFGFDVIDEPCVDSGNFQTLPDCDFETYAFFDDIHPTAKAHEIIGQGMFSALQPPIFIPNPDTEPVTVPFMPGILQLLLEE